MSSTTSAGQYVEFGIGAENYAIPISEVHEIIRMQDITEIPSGPPYVKGIFNLRGRIVPVIGLRRLFGLPEEEPDKATRIVVLNHADEYVGIVVDRVNQVVAIGDVQSPPDRIGGLSGALFAGIGITSSGLVGILKLDEVLLRD
ncbi:purine-binding chemotaxis protein CheW [Cohnella xylanilytica]|uniref:Purine-binding chemotaxis protein CheW n=1 Tax=Cohnella xylanilytica TaxID=557555 RepID=A0A841TZC8_9BACL|nr:chemotaxis protein CheW [Cohnella xylanilytica]MBB6691220.1 purine-binding chemotaxis protein CheW [Cohnella xylanilytica]